jgi:hypothetical protein
MNGSCPEVKITTGLEVVRAREMEKVHAYTKGIGPSLYIGRYLLRIDFL